MKDTREALQAILPEDRRQSLTRQAGGQAKFSEHVESAIIAANLRNFPTVEKTAAFALISLVRRCGSKPMLADTVRFTEAGKKGNETTKETPETPPPHPAKKPRPPVRQPRPGTITA